MMALPRHPGIVEIQGHAFAQQPPARLRATKHRGEMRCFAGLRALVDGKCQGVSSKLAFPQPTRSMGSPTFLESLENSALEDLDLLQGRTLRETNLQLSYRGTGDGYHFGA
jgi:hypothetical protein